MTDIEIYDRAVYAYLNDILPRVVYSPVDLAITQISKKLEGYKDHTPWTFISFYRDPNFDIDTTRDNYMLQNFGDKVSSTYNSDTGKLSVVNVQSIPVNLSYTIEAWAATASKVQELGIAIVSKITMVSPVIKAAMEPDGVTNARFHVTSVNWVDNSDLVSEEQHGRIYRHTISITIAANIKRVTNPSYDPFLYTNVPLEIYEGDDIYDQECTQCDFEDLEVYRADHD